MSGITLSVCLWTADPAMLPGNAKGLHCGHMTFRIADHRDGDRAHPSGALPAFHREGSCMPH